MRRLPDWLQAYEDWLAPTSEAPLSFIRWSGLFTIASVLKRNVCFPGWMMAGGYTYYPNIYVIFIAGAGVARKSTTTGKAERLLRQIPDIYLGTAEASDSALLGLMLPPPKGISEDGSISILSPEFGRLVAISQEKMYDFLTDLYDGKFRHDMETRLRGRETIENPCVNLLGATTPDVIATWPRHVIGGGFASRTIFVREEKPRQRALFNKTGRSAPEFEAIETSLLADLKHISTLKGEFKLEEGLQDRLEEWYGSNADEWMKAGDYRIEGYLNRKHAHVLKLLMLLSVSNDDQLIARHKHFDRAVELLEDVEKKLPQVFTVVGKNTFAVDQERVDRYIMERGPVTKGRILEHFKSDLDYRKLNELLGNLMLMGRVICSKGSFVSATVHLDGHQTQPASKRPAVRFQRKHQ